LHSRPNGGHDRTTDAARRKAAAFSRPGAGVAGAPRKAGRAQSPHSCDAAPFAAGERSERNAGNPRAAGGFTLVELIVVIVILAILAAIAIPALTGYIEKAKWADMGSRLRTQRTAVQTMIIEWINTYGDSMKQISTTISQLSGYGDCVYSGLPNRYPSYSFTLYKQDFIDEYEALTGDTASFSAPGFKALMAVTDGDGAIQYMSYRDYNYYGGSDNTYSPQLVVFWFEDIDDPILGKFGPNENRGFLYGYGGSLGFTDLAAAKALGFKTGMTIWKITALPLGANTLELLY
jgi:prepilin-type N-terminal cleavage/methylation domain-containing protein